MVWVGGRGKWFGEGRQGGFKWLERGGGGVKKIIFVFSTISFLLYLVGYLSSLPPPPIFPHTPVAYTEVAPGI